VEEDDLQQPNPVELDDIASHDPPQSPIKTAQGSIKDKAPLMEKGEERILSDVDERRLKRLQLRAEQRMMGKTREPQDGAVKKSSSKRIKKGPLSSSFVLRCKAEEIEEESTPSYDMQWFASKIVLKGIV
jgi:hypothetical protein